MVSISKEEKFPCYVNPEESLLVALHETPKHCGVIFDPIMNNGNCRYSDDVSGDYATVLTKQETVKLVEHLNRLLAIMDS